MSKLHDVVTNLGPRKPQRLSNNNTGTDLEEIRLLAGSSPTPPFKLCLETSFTNLHSPCAAPSNASSLTNGYHSTTSFPPSPVPLHSILSNLHSNTVHSSMKKMPTRSRSASRLSAPNVDLIHDDWFGLAPLASPESLSEVSSISSRASFTNIDKINLNFELRTPRVMRRTPKIPGNLSTCADDIKNVRYFQKISSQKFTTARCGSLNGSFTNTTSSGDLSYESASGTNENDAASSSTHLRIEEEEQLPESADEDERRRRVYLTTSDESDNYQSAENILDNVLESAGCLDFFNDTSSVPVLLETHFDELMFPSAAPHHVPEDPDAVSNFAIDLNLSEEHRSREFTRHRYPSSSAATSVDSGSICRTPVSETAVKNVTFNPQVINIVHSANSSPVKTKRSKKGDKWYLLPGLGGGRSGGGSRGGGGGGVVDSKVIHVPKTILCSKRNNNSDSGDECFARTAEALPLLSGLGAEKMSPNFVRRKKYVYPTMTVLNRGGESSV